jgi:hypothetical protein
VIDRSVVDRILNQTLNIDGMFDQMVLEIVDSTEAVMHLAVCLNEYPTFGRQYETLGEEFVRWALDTNKTDVDQYTLLKAAFAPTQSRLAMVNDSSDVKDIEKQFNEVLRYALLPTEPDTSYPDEDDRYDEYDEGGPIRALIDRLDGSTIVTGEMPTNDARVWESIGGSLEAALDDVGAYAEIRDARTHERVLILSPNALENLMHMFERHNGEG